MTAIFDFHVRLAPRPGAAAGLLRMLDSAGIARAAVCAGGTMDRLRLSRQLIDGTHVETDADNDAVLAAASSAGRLVPFHFGNPHSGSEAYRTAGSAVRGLEVSPAVHGVGFDDPRTVALVEVAASFGHPVYTVCLERPGCGVADLIRLASSFPSVNFVLGHTGIGNIDYYGVDLVADVPNVLVETSGGYSDVLRFAVERLGPDRLLFGSEAPLQHPRIELVKYEVLDLAADVWKRIAWDNAVRLLGLGDATEGGLDDLDHQQASAVR
jgi:predicted TIM-barrel fold metal-dependent hydrolase